MMRVWPAMLNAAGFLKKKATIRDFWAELTDTCDRFGMCVPVPQRRVSRARKVPLNEMLFVCFLWAGSQVKSAGSQCHVNHCLRRLWQSGALGGRARRGIKPRGVRAVVNPNDASRPHAKPATNGKQACQLSSQTKCQTNKQAHINNCRRSSTHMHTVLCIHNRIFVCATLFKAHAGK